MSTTSRNLVYVVGDAARPELAPNRAEQLQDGAKCDVIVHVVNTLGAWGKGFTAAIDDVYGPRAFEHYRSHLQVLRNNVELLGRVIWVRVWPDGPNPEGGPQHTYVAHLVAQNGLRSPARPRPFSIDALRLCVDSMVHDGIPAPRPRLHMPRIGTGLGGGKWSEIEPQVARLAAIAPTYIYDLP